ncbi:lysophosphatidic acid receptor 3-like [Acropora millepora]|uniref:lysophosphatidic acid receptor 3-like n=1 Tax=Acropora millepora TaxID=45264 RepID=UPI001CF3DE8F|nr:lysophosphatidic acid receptor 3-like [Acropora millepora]
MANHSQEQHEVSSVTPFFASGCIASLTVYGIEVVAIVTLNALTIIVYLKERSLRKRSMYLVINQAVADMFVGASLIYDFLRYAGDICEIWTINLPIHLHFIIIVLWLVSPLASLINLGAISLERTHATFCPFKHRLVKKKVFGAVAGIVWITAGAISFVIFPQFAFKSPFSKLSRTFGILFLTFGLSCLLTIIVSYSSIAVKIVYGTQSHHRSATSSGRKLTKTLFIVTVVSLLLTLPLIIILFCNILQLCTSIPLYLRFSFRVMFYANSLVNPVVYTFRIPGFKRALISFLRCRSQRQPAPGFPLNEM